MAYKSSEKFLEKNGKTWSYCHVDPKLGKPCIAHASHVSAKDFTNTLAAAVHGLEDHETEKIIFLIRYRNTLTGHAITYGEVDDFVDALKTAIMITAQPV